MLHDATFIAVARFLLVHALLAGGNCNLRQGWPWCEKVECSWATVYLVKSMILSVLWGTGRGSMYAAMCCTMGCCPVGCEGSHFPGSTEDAIQVLVSCMHSHQLVGFWCVEFGAMMQNP